MMNIIDFESRRREKQQNNSISLNEWLASGRTDEELRDVFIHMDLAMKYIHDKHYCIQSFSPKEIELMNQSAHQIKYKQLMKMPEEYNSQKEIVREDVYNSSYLQIGLYTNCFWEPSFLKENFEEIARMLPEEDIPYYKGIIDRGVAVYFSAYVVTKREKDLASLEKEVEGEGYSSGKRFIKSNGTSIASEDEKVNDAIYSQLNRVSDAAFISFLVVPILVAVLGTIFTIVALVSSMG